ncbi:MAG: hypothetical protein CMK07_05795 [Ponticaulis sp.]|nr:hypothetical protein [Ponticaulis sp.]
MTIRQFASDTRGNAAILFALVLTALASVLGLAVDFQRGVSAQVTIQSALDAMSLSAARSMEDADKSESDIRTAAQRVFMANLETANTNLRCPNATLELDLDVGTADARVSCTLPTTLASIFSIETVTISRSSSSAISMTQLDLAMMLDVSGSMAGDKIEDLREAANEAIDILITPKTGDRVRVAFNTYSTAINIGDYAERVKGSNYDSRSSTRKCATERKGTAKFKDDAPQIGKWIEEDRTANNRRSLACPSSSIEPLTNIKSRLHDSINDLTANGYTAGHLGIAWAWYLISPQWKDIWPSASEPHDYGANNTVKAVILMTDGEFNTYFEGAQGNSTQQSKKLCENMKKEGVIVYSVAFQAPLAGKRVLQSCASSNNHFFDASNGDELIAAYSAIASQLSNLRLTH